MPEYIDKLNLLEGIHSPDLGLEEIVDELIYKHNLDFLHGNDEDAVAEFASDLIESVKNYIRTEPTVNVREAKHGRWEEFDRVVCNSDGEPVAKIGTVYVCSECGREESCKEPCCHFGTIMDGKGRK